MKLPLLSEFLKAEEDKLIRAVRKNGLVSFKYTELTVFKRIWNAVTLNSRGITFEESTGKIVNRPFPKFFNYSELCNSDGTLNNNAKALLDFPEFIPNLSGKFRSSDKLDGSCGIAYKYNGNYYVNTCGSFESTQAVWATQFLNNSHIIKENMLDGYTYLFEIIWEEDHHPIKYNGINDLFLIGVIENETGKEVDMLSLIAEDLNCELAEIYNFTSFNELLNYASNLPNTKEGVVVTFENGYKCKIKGEEFLTLQKLYHKLTIDFFWEHMDQLTGKIPDDFLSLVPEEFEETAKEYVHKLETDYSNILEYIVNKGNYLMSLNLNDKDRYFKLIEIESDKKNISLILAYCNDIKKELLNTPHACNLIWKYIKPNI